MTNTPYSAGESGSLYQRVLERIRNAQPITADEERIYKAGTSAEEISASMILFKYADAQRLSTLSEDLKDEEFAAFASMLGFENVPDRRQFHEQPTIR